MTDDLRAARTLTQKDLDDAPVGTVVRGWQESRGATVERSVAVDCGMTILGARA